MPKVNRIEDTRFNLEFSGTLSPLEMEVAMDEFIEAAPGYRQGCDDV